jgi:hypothetical protein
MNADTFYLIKVIFAAAAVIFGLLGAVFTFADQVENERAEKTQAWFKNKWEAIDGSRWFTLPEDTTRWLLHSRSLILRVFDGLFEKREIVPRILLLCITFLSFVGCVLYWNIFIACLSIFFTGPFIIIGIFGKHIPNFFDRLFERFEWYLVISIFVSGIGTLVLWLQIIIRQELYYAAVIILLFVPFFWIAALMPVATLSDFLLDVNSKEWTDSLTLFSFGIAGGFTITLVALAIGHIVEPAARVPQTLQMLFSNVIFDGLTMALTFTILSRALSKDGLLRLPMGILLDIVLAAIFAVLSLFLGVALTEKALGLAEILYILIGRSSDNSHFEFSPYFWVMHTTFIPTLLYLSLILFCWIGKTMLFPVRWFFGKGQENKNPMKLTGLLFGVFATIFGGLVVLTGLLQERAKEVQTRPNQPNMIENQNTEIQH